MWFQHPLQDGMANSERKLFHTHRALEPKVRTMERWSPDPLDGSTTCRYVSVHVQTVDSLNYIFDVKLHQYLNTCNTLTRKEPKGFTTKALVVFLHDWSWWHIPFIWWYIYLAQLVYFLEFILLRMGINHDYFVSTLTDKPMRPGSRWRPLAFQEHQLWKATGSNLSNVVWRIKNGSWSLALSWWELASPSYCSYCSSDCSDCSS